MIQVRVCLARQTSLPIFDKGVQWVCGREALTVVQGYRILTPRRFLKTSKVSKQQRLISQQNLPYDGHHCQNRVKPLTHNGFYQLRFRGEAHLFKQFSVKNTPAGLIQPMVAFGLWPLYPALAASTLMSRLRRWILPPPPEIGPRP